MLTQVVGGKLADRYGGEVVIWPTSVLWALGCLALSYLTYSSRAVVALGRFVVGVAQGECEGGGEGGRGQLRRRNICCRCRCLHAGCGQSGHTQSP